MDESYISGLWLCLAFFAFGALIVLVGAFWDDLKRWRRNRRRKKCGWLRLWVAHRLVWAAGQAIRFAEAWRRYQFGTRFRLCVAMWTKKRRPR